MLPRLVRGLQIAEDNRRVHLQRLAGGARLRGANAILVYLDQARDTYARDDALRQIVFLIERATADFETAIEATLSGYATVAADVMRDIMEIELLLLDFASDPEQLDTWLNADGRVRWRLFKPAALRRRLTDQGVDAYTSTAGRVDYAAHSESLHVTPKRLHFPARGVQRDDSAGFLADAGWWEIFEHAFRLIQAIEAVRLRFGAEHDKATAADLGLIWDARSRTQELQTMYVAMLTAPRELQERLGREPTTVEILKFVRDRLADPARAQPERPS